MYRLAVVRPQDQSQVDQLYCLALVHRRDLPSLRALTAEELPLLENVRDKGCQVGGWWLMARGLWVNIQGLGFGVQGLRVWRWRTCGARAARWAWWRGRNARGVGTQQTSSNEHTCMVDGMAYTLGIVGGGGAGQAQRACAAER